MGLLLVAATIVTVDYYYSVVPVEVEMAADGFTLIVVSYGLTKYLKQPRYGSTYHQSHLLDTQAELYLESLVQVQTFAVEPSPADTIIWRGQFWGWGSEW